MRTPVQFPLVLGFLSALAPVARGQASDSTNEFWPEIDVFIKLNERSRIFAMYAGTKPESLGTYADGQSGVHIDFYALRSFRRHLINYVDPSRSKMLMVRAGYLVSRPKNSRIRHGAHGNW